MAVPASFEAARDDPRDEFAVGGADAELSPEVRGSGGGLYGKGFGHLEVHPLSFVISHFRCLGAGWVRLPDG